MHLPATENKAHPTNNPIHGKYVQFISNYIFFPVPKQVNYSIRSESTACACCTAQGAVTCRMTLCKGHCK